MSSRYFTSNPSGRFFPQPRIFLHTNALTGLQQAQGGSLCRSLEFSLCSALSSPARCLGFRGLSSLSPQPREAAGCLGSHPHTVVWKWLSRSWLTSSVSCLLGITVLCCLIPSVLRRSSLYIFGVICWF